MRASYFVVAVLASLVLAGGCPQAADNSTGIAAGTYIGNVNVHMTTVLGGDSTSQWPVSVVWDGSSIAIDGVEYKQGSQLSFESALGPTTSVVNNVAVSTTQIQIATSDTTVLQFPDQTVHYIGTTIYTLTSIDAQTLRYEILIRCQGMLKNGVLSDLTVTGQGNLVR